MDFRHRRQRMEHAHALVAATEQRGVAAGCGHRAADRAAVRHRLRPPEPALRTAPFDQLLAAQDHRAGVRRHRQPPQAAAAEVGVWSRRTPRMPPLVIRQHLPTSLRCAASTAASAPDRRSDSTP
jgi:hypothetical protein